MHNVYPCIQAHPYTRLYRYVHICKRICVCGYILSYTRIQAHLNTPVYVIYPYYISIYVEYTYENALVGNFKHVCLRNGTLKPPALSFFTVTKIHTHLYTLNIRMTTHLYSLNIRMTTHLYTLNIRMTTHLYTLNIRMTTHLYTLGIRMTTHLYTLDIRMTTHLYTLNKRMTTHLYTLDIRMTTHLYTWVHVQAPYTAALLPFDLFDEEEAGRSLRTDFFFSSLSEMPPGYARNTRPCSSCDDSICKRAHSTEGEHILQRYARNTRPYHRCKRTHSAVREHILQ